MARSVLSPQAHEDLRELRDYIARDDPAAARRVLHDLREAIRRLAQTPELGHLQVAEQPVTCSVTYVRTSPRKRSGSGPCAPTSSSTVPTRSHPDRARPQRLPRHRGAAVVKRWRALCEQLRYQ